MSAKRVKKDRERPSMYRLAHEDERVRIFARRDSIGERVRKELERCQEESYEAEEDE